jgi:DNA/RNA-binding domain of Phe-tRNA-synthetase-like protein
VADAIELVVAPGWHAAHPGATVGVLAIRGVANPERHPTAEAAADGLERGLRERYAGLGREELRAVGPLPAYAAYYKRFGQRYHVALQLESVVLKGKPVPRRGALVGAMFGGELRNLILTAGHDGDEIAGPLRLDVGTGAERFVTPAGAEATVKPGDMYVGDGAGVLSAVIAGPAGRARIGPGTTAALFVAYAPLGVAPSAVAAHLDEIAAGVREVCPGAGAAAQTVVVGGGQG